MLNSILAGLLIAVAAFWACYVFNRLWQEQLAREADGALRGAVARGLTVLTPGWSAALVAEGRWAGQALRVEWRAGLWGPASRLTWGGRRWSGPLLQSEEELGALLPAQASDES